MSNDFIVRVTPPASSLEQNVNKDANSVRIALNGGDLQAAEVHRGAGPGLHDSKKSAMTAASSNEASWSEGSRFDVMA